MLNVYSKGKGGRKRWYKVNLFVYKHREAIKKNQKTTPKKAFKTRVANAIISLT